MERKGHSASEILAALQLARRKGVGAASFRRLVATHGSVEAATASYCPGKVRYPDKATLERELVATEKFLDSGGIALVVDQEGYPPQLGALGEPPPVLFVRGDPGWLARPSLAIVGARECDDVGLEDAAALARLATRAGLVVISGGALGVDAAAHVAALESGSTVAVVATGVDVAYPAVHCELFARIANEGAVVSELLPGTGPRRSFFPTRNRIIAGLASAVVIVRGRASSGALITARWARTLGRPMAAMAASGSLGDAARSLEGVCEVYGSLDDAARWITSIAAAAATHARSISYAEAP